MPKGFSDWGVIPTSITQFDFDTGELAVRLGYPDSYLRSGKTIFFDQFDAQHSGWTVGGFGGTPVSKTVNGTRQTGHFSQTLQTPGAGTNGTELEKKFPSIISGFNGFSFLFKPDTNTSHVNIGIRHIINGLQYSAVITYRHDLRELRQLTSPSTWNTLLTNGYLDQIGTDAFHLFRIAADLTNHKYVSVRIDNEYFDISTQDMYNAVSVDSDGIRFNIYHQATAANVGIMYVDNAIATIDDIK